MYPQEQINILTFDIEEWFHFDIFCPESEWLNKEPRIDLYLSPILDKLDKLGIKATFFCLGWIAEHYPNVLKKIQSRGHEFACHSNKHLFVREMTPESFDEDLKQSLMHIENVIGEKVTAFRAPAFSISEDSTWAFEVLANNGITTDCSIFATTRSFGGFPSFGDSTPALIEYKNCKIKELPVSTCKILGKDFVFSGGGYFRLFPYWFIRKEMNKLNYNMTYIHMRDFDFEQPQINDLSFMRKFKSYHGIKEAYPKFLKMLNDFKWISVGQALDKIDFNTVRKVIVK